MKRVLVIDDNSDILWVVSIILKKYDFEVMAVPGGQEALKKVKTFSPDVILLDVFLSGMDGIEVCNKLKRNSLTSEIPIIMFSAHTSFKDVSQFCQADDFISKPFDVHELVEKIQDHIVAKSD
ncbi:MAG: response regulator [Bacteroidota bacterium]|nr:response regulator [Bacteroidota bacterium]